MKREMPSHHFNYPKVTAVKATSPHRETEVHPVVRKDEAEKEPVEQVRPRRDV
jgi:hypothetical protein